MEAAASEQIALLNLAYIYLEAPKHSIDLSLCETKLLEALVVPTKMHTASTEKIFSSLRKIYQDSKQVKFLILFSRFAFYKTYIFLFDFIYF
jgi:hypothetical protein